MATTSPNNISYPTNASTKKTFENHVKDTADSVQTALNTKANLSGDTFTGGITSAFTSTAAHIIVSNTGAATTDYNYILSGANDTGTKVVHFLNNSGRTSDGGASGYTIRNDGGPLNLGHPSYNTTISGRVLAPNQPAFYANGANIYHTMVNQGNIPFSIVKFDTGSNFNTSTYRFTAPVAGAYQINATLFYISAGNRVSIKVNNASKYDSQTLFDTEWSWSGTIYLAAGDYVTVGDWQDSAGGQVYLGHSSFSGFLVG